MAIIRVFCTYSVFRKPRFTGFSPKARNCSHPAVYETPAGPRCTRHTPSEFRLRQNLYGQAVGKHIASSGN